MSGNVVEVARRFPGAVVIGAEIYKRISSWLPHRRIRYGVIYGEAISIRPDLDKAESAKVMEEELKAAFVRLYRELVDAMAGA